MKKVLVLSGLDPTGGAGLIADVRVLTDRGIFAAGVPTALTSQSGWKVRMITPVSSKLLASSLESLLEAHQVDGVKVGMIFSPPVARVITKFLKTAGNIPVVVDPVLTSTRGHPLSTKKLESELLRIIELATLITPNGGELEHIGKLIGISGKHNIIARSIVESTGTSVLLTGGHRKKGKGIDLLFTSRGRFEIKEKYILRRDYHGTGCLYSTAILSYLIEGKDLLTSVKMARRYISKALERGFKSKDGRWFWSLD